jgi:hypothetical protein
MAIKTVNLNFDMINVIGENVGTTGPIVADQMKAYINIMTRTYGEEHPIVLAMNRAKREFEIDPFISNLNTDEFNIVYNWLINISGFYDTELGQPFTQIKNAFENA